MRSSKLFCQAVLLLITVALPFLHTASAQSGKVGVQFKVSTLGIGGEVGLQVLPRANLRAGFGLFNYTHTFHNDGIAYDGSLHLRSVTASFDWYLIGPLHVGPGILLYNGFKGSALASAPAGTTFTLGGTTFQSSAANPLGGTLAITGNRVAPELLIGFGNPVPRNGRRFTTNIDLGVVFQGSPESALALTGFACAPGNSSGPTCVNAATNPIVQASMRAQEAKLNDDLSVLRYFPVISFGIGFRF